jgi:hypothetical protein
LLAARPLVLVVVVSEFVHRKDLYLEDKHSIDIKEQEHKLEKQWQLEWDVKCTSKHTEFKVDHEQLEVHNKDKSRPDQA